MKTLIKSIVISTLLYIVAALSIRVLLYWIILVMYGGAFSLWGAVAYIHTPSFVYGILLYLFAERYITNIRDSIKKYLTNP